MNRRRIELRQNDTVPQTERRIRGTDWFDDSTFTFCNW